jgi:hypothetical protein
LWRRPRGCNLATEIARHPAVRSRHESAQLPMSRAGILLTTAVGAGSIAGLLALVGAPTWALVGSAFGFSFLIWDSLEDQPV